MTPSRRGRGFQVVGTLVVAALSALSWVAWLGWDDQYQVDPETGVSSGPYEAWQVIGCALTLLVLFAGALLLRVHALPAAVALTVAFTAAWTAQAASTDETGLYMVGAVLLVFGLAVGTALVAAMILVFRYWWVARRRPTTFAEMFNETFK